LLFICSRIKKSWSFFFLLYFYPTVISADQEMVVLRSSSGSDRGNMTPLQSPLPSARRPTNSEPSFRAHPASTLRINVGSYKNSSKTLQTMNTSAETPKSKNKTLQISESTPRLNDVSDKNLGKTLHAINTSASTPKSTRSKTLHKHASALTISITGVVQDDGVPSSALTPSALTPSAWQGGETRTVEG
jgi:hypothetical protein